MNYSDYKDQVSSEKLVLSTLDASKRLMGWELHSGSVYKIEGFKEKLIISIEDSGSPYLVANSLASVNASGKYFLDRNTETLYLWATADANPNSRFLVGNFRYFFANVPVSLPWDLNTGFEVPWEPLIDSTSAFGVEIDTVNQSSESIEGSGSLTLINDQDFWPKTYDKLTFENKPCVIYSYNRNIEDPTQAKKLFDGKVEKKTYDSKKIKFNLRDLLSELRTNVPLANIEDLSARTLTNLAKAKQRMIFGRVFGHRPVNTDEVLAGYPLTGTISVTNGSINITGTGTEFLAELSPGDQIPIDGLEYTIGEVTSDTAATLTEEFVGTDGTFTTVLIPDQPKRWMNRTWKVAGHAVREPQTLTESGSTVTRIYVQSTKDMYAEDTIYVGTLGSGELAIIEEIINDKLLRLRQSLSNAPLAGVAVRKPSVQNVRINDTKLTYYRDYTFDPSTAVLTLNEDAEANAFPIRQMATDLVFTNGSRIVTGAGLDAIFKPGYMVGCMGNNTEFYEVLAVSETELILRTASTFTDTGNGLYKEFVFDAGDDVLSCDVMGRTADGLANGALVASGPDMVKTLLEDLELTSILDTASFDNAKEIAYQELGLVIPEKYNETKVQTYRDVINAINKSINGSLVQTQGFNLKYLVLQPNKSATALRLREEDVLSLKTNATSEYVAKTIRVEYCPREYDYSTATNTIQTHDHNSDNAEFVVQTDRTKVLTTKLVNERSARMFSERWATILEMSAGSVSIDTKLQGALLEVGDIIDLEHRKLFVRLSGDDKRRLLLVEKVKKDGYKVSIEAVDLSNLFNRAASITTSSNEFDDASEDEKLYGGYITDQYGMQANNPDTFGSNIIF